MRVLPTSIAMLLLLFSCSSWGQVEQETRSLNLSGFGTLGFVHSNNKEVDYVRDLLQVDGVGRTRKLDFGVDSLLGLQADYAIFDGLSATAQVVSRRAQSNFKPDLTWGFLRYAPNDTAQVRLGRLGFDVYLLADSRNVGSSYPWVRPPIEFFGSLIISHIDGGDVVLKQSFGNGVMQAKIYSGTAQEKASTGGLQSEFFSLEGSPLVGGHVEYVDQHWHARIGLAQLRFKNEFPQLNQLISALQTPLLQNLDPNAASYAQGVRFQDKRVRYLSSGLAYDRGPFKAQVMLSRMSSHTLGFPSNNAGFTTISYRMGKWTPYVSYSKIKSIHTPPTLQLPLGLDPQLDALAKSFYQVTHAQLADQQTQSLGLRFDLSESTDIKVQVDRIRSHQGLLIRYDHPSWNGRGTLFSLALNFVF